MLNKFNMELENNEEQMGFRRNRSTTDAIYVVRQIVEKSIKYNSPVLAILTEKNVSGPLINLIQYLYQDTSTSIKVGDGTTAEIPTKAGIRQGDSLSPMLFNIIMDKIINDVKSRL